VPAGNLLATDKNKQQKETAGEKHSDCTKARNHLIRFQFTAVIYTTDSSAKSTHLTDLIKRNSFPAAKSDFRCERKRPATADVFN